MKKPAPLASDDELDQLLARGRLSGAQYDAVEQNVLDRLSPRRRRAVLPVLAPVAALAAAASLWIVLGRQGPDGPAQGVIAIPSAPALTEKGGGEPALGVVTVGCASATPLTCKPNDTLMFSVTGNTVPVYLTAYAEPVDAASPSPRIWYFPRAGAAAPRVDVAAGTSVLSEGVRLGPPHTRGRYRVVTRLTTSPPTAPAAEATAAPGDARSHALEIRE